MMHAIGREPTHLVDLDLEVVDHAAPDVLEPERTGTVGALVPHGSDQTGTAIAGQREDGEKVGLVEVGVQFAIDGTTGRLDVGDVEDLAIRPTLKACA
jgi:hypothetical protein